jgi:hypothetical protein
MAQRKPKEFNYDELTAQIEQVKNSVVGNKRLYEEKVYESFYVMFNGIFMFRNLSDEGKKNVANLVDQHGPEKFVRGVNEAIKYLKVKVNEAPEEQNIEIFFDKLPAVLNNIDKPELEKKKAYILGIAKNRFGNWSLKKMILYLNWLEELLRKHSFDSDDIVDYLDETIIPTMINAKHWTAFKTAEPHKFFIGNNN